MVGAAHVTSRRGSSRRAHPDAVVLDSVAPILLAVVHLLQALHGQQVLLDGLILHAVPQQPHSQQLILCCRPCNLLRQGLELHTPQPCRLQHSTPDVTE